jgi:hypothetical protein
VHAVSNKTRKTVYRRIKLHCPIECDSAAQRSASGALRSVAEAIAEAERSNVACTQGLARATELHNHYDDHPKHNKN